MAEWPLSLPDLPLRDGYEEEWADTRLRTEMDAGPAKMRGRHDAGMDTLPMSFHMTSAQVNILRSFYKNTLSRGALAFDYAHPRTREQQSFRFVVPPKVVANIATGVWLVTVQLEFMGSAEALSFVDTDFRVPGNSGYVPLVMEDI